MYSTNWKIRNKFSESKSMEMFSINLPFSPEDSLLFRLVDGYVKHFKTFELVRVKDDVIKYYPDITL